MSTFFGNVKRAWLPLSGRTRGLKRTSALWFFGALLLLGMAPAEFPYHRKIEASPGWNQLELPTDVIAAAKPGLSDVRILAKSGEEIPFSKGRELPTPASKRPLVDVERGSDTTALLDRGAHPGWLDAAELVIEDDEFIKPVKLEASDDRTSWQEIARGSIFATASGVRMTTLHFAASDRRYWRFRFDDKNGRPVTPTHVVVRPVAHAPSCAVVRGNAKQVADADRGVSTYAITLSHPHVPVASVHIHASDAAFARRARVFERIWFRDQVSRRSLGEAEITNGPTGEPKDRVLIAEPTGTTLEVDIERTSSVALHDVTFDLCVEPRLLYFHLAEGATAELVYGADIAAARYDVESALAEGRPEKIARAALGPLVETGAPTRTLPEITRGAALEVRGWKTEHTIALPSQGPIAYLDVDPDLTANMRIVDKTGHQVPYVVEAESRHVRTPVGFRVEKSDTELSTRLSLDAVPKGLDALELEVSSPEYFSREAVVEEELFDARGRTGVRRLGSAKLARVTGSAPSALRIPITENANESHIVLRLTNRDNAPLTVTGITADSVRRRVDFVFESGDELRLLSGNTKASAPWYDLSLVAGRVLESPAEAATLGEPRALTEAKIVTPVWFWIFVFAAAVLLLLALARTLRQPTVKS